MFAALDAEGVSGATVAAATAGAAAERFEALKSDATLQRTVWYLARLASAANESDFVVALGSLGFDTDRAVHPAGLVAELSRVVRADVGAPSPLGELALKSAQRVLAETLLGRPHSLFGDSIEEVQASLQSCSSAGGFGKLARDFFGAFTANIVRFLAEKELSNHVGPEHALRSTSDAVGLSRDIERYCRESAEIVREFASGWYSKANWKTSHSIDLERTEGFLAYSLTKIRTELEAGASR